MPEIARLAPLAIMLALMTSAAEAGAVQGHDDGLTCHEHPTGGWSVQILPFIEQLDVHLGGSLSVVVDEAGRPRIRSRSALAFREDPAHHRAVLTLHSDGATMSCSESGMDGFDLLFESRRTGHRASLFVVPLEPVREPGRHAVHFRLEHGTGVTHYDGAILVVSAADGPMP